MLWCVSHVWRLMSPQGCGRCPLAQQGPAGKFTGGHHCCGHRITLQLQIRGWVWSQVADPDPGKHAAPHGGDPGERLAPKRSVPNRKGHHGSVVIFSRLCLPMQRPFFFVLVLLFWPLSSFSDAIRCGQVVDSDWDISRCFFFSLCLSSEIRRKWGKGTLPYATQTLCTGREQQPQVKQPPLSVLWDKWLPPLLQIGPKANIFQMLNQRNKSKWLFPLSGVIQKNKQAKPNHLPLFVVSHSKKI